MAGPLEAHPCWPSELFSQFLFNHLNNMGYWFKPPGTQPPKSHSKTIVSFPKDCVLDSGPLNFGSNLGMDVFLSLKSGVMFDRSLAWATEFSLLFYSELKCNGWEASGPMCKSSCPIFVFQGKIHYVGYWLRAFTAIVFHCWPQFQIAVKRPWAWAYKLPFKYYASYSKRLCFCILLRYFVLITLCWELASELLFQI